MYWLHCLIIWRYRSAKIVFVQPLPLQLWLKLVRPSPSSLVLWTNIESRNLMFKMVFWSRCRSCSSTLARWGRITFIQLHRS
jgi:hypothetical protein